MRSLPDPGFGGDMGDAPAELGAALAAYDADPDSVGLRHAALAALQDARVLVPVVAVLGEVERGDDGLAREKSSDMAAVLMRGRDGRTALLAFSSTAALQSWDPRARPVPVGAADAAKAAVQDGADALLVDVAGPVLFPVEDDDLRALAAGRRLVRLPDGAWGWTLA